MPFTLSHPAIIVPLNRYAGRLTSLSALVIGSMMPDLPYFLLTGASGDFSHTLLGILAYCVPVGALIYMLYYALLRDALIAWAPWPVAARLQAPQSRPPSDARSVAVVLVSLGLGAASHLIWDAFTHGGTLVTAHLRFMRTPVSLGGYVLPLFKLLQHLSSLLGFIVIASSIAAWFRRTPPATVDRRSASGGQRLFVVIAIVTAALGGGLAGLLFRRADTFEHMLFNVVVTSMATAALTIVALCAGWRFSSRSRARP